MPLPCLASRSSRAPLEAILALNPALDSSSENISTSSSLCTCLFLT
ncbi:hypothetical protein BFJ71_g1006 [Fusarium oxysporum]|nr:hypothetical protein BFJ71_g1006 [Fusarium oxysporum]